MTRIIQLAINSWHPSFLAPQLNAFKGRARGLWIKALWMYVPDHEKGPCQRIEELEQINYHWQKSNLKMCLLVGLTDSFLTEGTTAYRVLTESFKVESKEWRDTLSGRLCILCPYSDIQAPCIKFLFTTQKFFFSLETSIPSLCSSDLHSPPHLP